MSYCDGWLHARFNIFVFLDLSIKDLENVTLQRSLTFQMSLLEMLENVNVSQIHLIGPT